MPRPSTRRTDAARVRAMYTHPAFARRGVGRLILQLCEAAAAAEGFRELELMGTLSGRPLYEAAGFTVIEDAEDASGGAAVPLVKMRKGSRPRPASGALHYRARVFDIQHLGNGTRLLTAPQADAQSTCVMVMYAVGSRYEDDATGGISHFAEHLFFKGTERRPTARVIATEIDGIGAEFNAFTGKEYTGYYVKCAKEHVPVAIDVLGDMLLHSLSTPRRSSARRA